MSTLRRRPAVWRAAAVLAVAVIATLVVVRAQSQNAPPAATRTSATAWRLPSLVGGGEVSLAGLRGHPAVVDFFASWCTACRGELPGFAVLSEQLRGQVTFVGVDSEENGDGLAMARQLGIGAWPLARDVGGTQASGLHDALGARGMPLTAFYDRSGRLLAVVVGAISEDDLGGRLRALYGVSA